MSEKVLKPSAGNVSKVLSDALLNKSNAYPSAIRGWKNYSSGFVCKKTDDGACLVRYRSDMPSDEQVNARLASYRKVLESHFDVADESNVLGPCLKISAKVSQ